MDTDDQKTLAPAQAPASPPLGDPPARSHTQANPVQAPHTKTGRSTISTPEPYVRIFLLIWAVRYIPRGILGELFDSRTFAPLKKVANALIEKGGFMTRQTARVEAALTKHAQTVGELKNEFAGRSISKNIPQALYDDLQKALHTWRGDASKQAPRIIEQAVLENGKYTISDASRSVLHSTVRGRLDDMLYSIILGFGSGAVTLHYSKNVRTDIKNLFSETVALEKGIPDDKVTFADIARSDNNIIRHTIENYRGKRNGRLFSDSLFLLTAPLKSMHITDALLGLKGWQMFSDTKRRHPTMFEDLVTLVNNKINPVNGLGQPLNVGEVLDLYQHYTQAYRPKDAFVGVIEHEQAEGARWAENQVVFQRLTELLNKTYAYKHQSIVDHSTGLTVLQADFALPKFLYLLGHDLIDVHAPEKTLVRIEVLNRYGVKGLKEMERILASGRTLEDVMRHYPVQLTKPEQQIMESSNGVMPKDAGQQIDAVPVAKISVDSIRDGGVAEAATRYAGAGIPL